MSEEEKQGIFDNAFGGTLDYCEYDCSKHCQICDYDMNKVNEKYACKACYNCAVNLNE